MVSNVRLPYIIFTDMDHTLIGQAEAECDRYWVMRVAKDLEESHELPQGTCPDPLIDARSEIAPLLRPGVGAGLRKIRAALPDSEFFVCSYGQQSILNDLKMKGFEAATGFRFRRPFFSVTSDEETNLKPASSHKTKLVRKCFDVACARLARRVYPDLRDAKAVEEVFRNRFFMVDDKFGIAYDKASNSRLVVCPPYTFRPPPRANKFEGLPSKVLRHPKVRDFILNGLSSKQLPEQQSDKDDNFWERLALVVKESNGSIPNILRYMRTQ